MAIRAPRDERGEFVLVPIMGCAKSSYLQAHSLAYPLANAQAVTLA